VRADLVSRARRAAHLLRCYRLPNRAGDVDALADEIERLRALLRRVDRRSVEVTTVISMQLLDEIREAVR
jgi:hypothetical protein